MGNPYQDQHHFPRLVTHPPGELQGPHSGDGLIPVIVRGRGKLTATARVDVDGTVVIRLDDAALPEFWAEVHLLEGDIQGLLALSQKRSDAYFKKSDAGEEGPGHDPAA